MNRISFWTITSNVSNISICFYAWELCNLLGLVLFAGYSLPSHHGLKRDTIGYFIEIFTTKSRKYKSQIRRVVPNGCKLICKYYRNCYISFEPLNHRKNDMGVLASSHLGSLSPNVIDMIYLFRLVVGRVQYIIVHTSKLEDTSVMLEKN